MPHSRIIGTGSYLPVHILTNQELEQRMDTSNEWIIERTGISQRHIAAPGECTSDLGRQAAERALQNAGITAEQLDLIIVATTTPDRTFPATATKIQAKLGANKAVAFDLQAVCSGFVFALATADNFIRAGQAKRALIIGAETMSRLVDWTDRGTCVLFGDGAGAVVLEATEEADRGVLATQIYSDGSFEALLYADGGVSSTQESGKLRMEGREVFKHAVEKMSRSVEDILAKQGLTAEHIDWLIPHQANARIIQSVGKKLRLSDDKVIVTVGHHGNTSAASIPLALDEAVQQGKIRPGQLLVFEALGGGFTWGAAVVRW